jgi:hypothetical protein
MLADTNMHYGYKDNEELADTQYLKWIINFY